MRKTIFLAAMMTAMTMNLQATATPDYLYFVNLKDAPATVQLKKESWTKGGWCWFEYSTNRTNWERFQIYMNGGKWVYDGPIIPIPANDTIFWRAGGNNGEEVPSHKNSKLSIGDGAAYFHFVFGTNDSIAAGGNIMSLYDATCEQDTMTEYGFSHMFINATQLVKAPKLPATKLAKGCYSGMFEGCTNLKEAPQLTVDTLPNDCYKTMFKGTPITSITVPFTHWNAAGNATLEWLPTTVTSFVCPLELPIREAEWGDAYTSYVPSGCVVYKQMEQDDSDLETKLESAQDATSTNVTIQYTLNRPIYKDGLNNTICLPFALTAEQIAASPLANYARLQSFVSATVENQGQPNETLVLTLSDATAIEAGKPYLMAWNEGEDLSALSFTTKGLGVFHPEAVGASPVQFKGTFAPFAVEKDDMNYMFVGTGAELKWPNKGGQINGFRGYFAIDDSPAGVAIRRGMKAMLSEGRNTPTGCSEIEMEHSKVQKLMEQGRVVIISNGVRYDLNGNVIK